MSGNVVTGIGFTMRARSGGPREVRGPPGRLFLNPFRAQSGAVQAPTDSTGSVASAPTSTNTSICWPT
jgi:hypothetical protein